MNNIEIEVVGKKIDRFIKRLFDNNIEVYNIEKLSNDKVIIVINKKDYNHVLKIRTIYKIRIYKNKGINKIKEVLKSNKILIFSMFLGLSIVFFLSNIIFDIEVIHNNKKISDIIKNELSYYGVNVHKLKKSRRQIDIIKNKILDKYKDEIEWLEIEEKGTSYIIRFEERIIPSNDKENPNKSIVAKKNGVITKIVAAKGVVEKLKGEYVNKGDVVINGEIKLNEEVKNKVSAEGVIYADVWYTVKVKYPYIYKETRLTNNCKNVLSLVFLNKKIDIFSKSYANYIEDKKFVFSTSFLPIYVKFAKQTERIVIDRIYTLDEAVNVAINKSNSTIKKKLKKDEYIKDYKILSTNYYENYIELEIFYSINENITDYKILD